MVQPKYSPQEALEKIKLSMKYDSSKTLNENRNSISEQQEWKNDPNYKIASEIWNSVGGMGTNTEKFLSGLKKITSADQFRLVNAQMEKFNNNMTIDEWVNDDFGTDDTEAVKEAINHLKSIGITATAEFGSTGKFKENTFKISAPTEQKSAIQKMVQAAVSKRQEHVNKMWCSVKNGIITAGGQWNGSKWEEYKTGIKLTDAEIEAAKKSCPKDGKKRNSGGQGGTTYKPCSGEYTRGCKSLKIKEVQICLGMPKKYQTGNFGPITQAKLAEVGKSYSSGFKDADIATICGTNTTKQPVKPAGVDDLADETTANTEKPF